jgi:predicted metal-binding membrane protein
MGLALGSDSDTGLGPAYRAARTRIGLVAALFAVAAIAWVWTAHEMRRMDAGPWTSLGGLGWFIGIWVVMMAAMMLPSVAPTIALYARITREKSPLSPWMFLAGYLLMWAVVGLLVYLVGAVAVDRFGDLLAWDRAGRTLAGVTLVVAALYEVSPPKDACLAKWRSPLGELLGSWRNGPSGAMRMGVGSGGWCVGGCWALMASLFALGVMSVPWMAFIAGVIAAEKTLPWRRGVTYATAAVLLAIGVLILVAPDAVPGLTIPSAKPMPMD